MSRSVKEKDAYAMEDFFHEAVAFSFNGMVEPEISLRGEKVVDITSDMCPVDGYNAATIVASFDVDCGNGVERAINMKVKLADLFWLDIEGMSHNEHHGNFDDVIEARKRLRQVANDIRSVLDEVERKADEYLPALA